MPNQTQIENSINYKFKDLGDGTFARFVALEPGSFAGADKELVVSTYSVKTPFTGASIGNTITATQIIDVSTVPPSTITTIWRNQTTATDLASAPSAANLELTGSQALTDSQLRAQAVTVSPNITRGSGVMDSNTTRVTMATDGPLVTGVGSSSDAVATTDTGTFSIIALIKRSLQNWTALLNRVPNSIGNRIPIDPLGIPQVARQLQATSTSNNTILTSTVSRISIYARNADIRYSVGSSVQTASSTSHFIASGERLDLDVPSTPNIAVIRSGTVDGILEVTELT